MMAFLGKSLDVDLTEGRIEISNLSEELVRKFLGGRGINAWLLHQHAAEGVQPLEPGNILILSCGLLTGTAAPASSRLHVSSKSPLTGIMGSSNVGGGFGAKLYSTGFQCILIRGRAKTPVTLWIRDRNIQIVDASSLWGLDTWETQERLRNELGDEGLEIMAIGPGGENLVPFACIMTDRDHAAGRTGMGAVMGSKNLKAIVVRGGKRWPRIDPSSVSAVKGYIHKIKSSPRYRDISTYGSAGDIRWINEMGIMATRNYRETQFGDYDKIEGKQFQRYVTRLKSCHRCPVHCKADIRVTRGPFRGTDGTRPEFEPIIALGSKCGMSNTEALLYLCDLCSRLGIDSISTGGVIAFAMDLHDRGILTAEEAGGIDLTWGNHEAMETLIYQIVRRKGLGGILSHGVREAARIIGKGSERFACHAKGLELTGYDPRGLVGTALGYAVSPRGGDFTSIYATAEYRWSPETAETELGDRRAVDRFSSGGTAALIRRCMIVSAVLDSLGLCKVPALTLIGDFDLKDEAALTACLTGWAVGPEELLQIGERIVTVERLFNVRNGVGPGDDRIPDRFLEEPIEKGPAKGHTIRLEPMVKEFYRVMGWDDTGHPAEERLTVLGLAEVPQGLGEHNTKGREDGEGAPQPRLPARNRSLPIEGRKESGHARRQPL